MTLSVSPFQLELMAIELLKRGADPNKERGHNGSTPLHLAIIKENLDLAKKLLIEGAQLETRDDYGYTPLLEAVNFGASAEIIDLLLEHGANVHAVTKDKNTALHFAAQHDDANMIRILTERGLLADVEDNNGCTPLHEAAHHGSKDAAEILTEKGQSLI